MRWSLRYSWEEIGVDIDRVPKLDGLDGRYWTLLSYCRAGLTPVAVRWIGIGWYCWTSRHAGGSSGGRRPTRVRARRRSQGS